MAREVNIDYAISETLKKHPDFAPYLSNIIYKNIYKGTNPVNFTFHVREMINTAEQVDFVNYILNEAIIIYNAAKQLIDENDNYVDFENLNSHFPMFAHIKRAIALLRDKNNNTIFYYLCNRTELFELIEAVTRSTFKKQWYTGDITRDIRTSYHDRLLKLAANSSETETLKRMLKKETNAFKNIKNLEINYDAINICQREVLLGNQVKYTHNEYSLGEMTAAQDVGTKRKNQEDSVLILEHEDNPKFKILAVADGMGGHNYGEVASNFVLANLSKWFNSLSSEFFEYPEQLQELLNEELIRISNELYKYLGSKPERLQGGSTFTGAIVTRDKTIVSSVGDSRAYLLSKNNLFLVTQDESRAWRELLEQKRRDNQSLTYSDIDKLRTAPNNNVILRCMGSKDLNVIQSYLINNSDYDQLLLFSDGITDILSSEEIRIICTATPPDLLAKTFVRYAISNDVKKQFSSIDHEIELVNPGKDNASSVAYIRRRR